MADLRSAAGRRMVRDASELVKSCAVASLSDAQSIPRGHAMSAERPGFGAEIDEAKVEKKTQLKLS